MSTSRFFAALVLAAACLPATAQAPRRPALNEYGNPARPTPAPTTHAIPPPDLPIRLYQFAPYPMHGRKVDRPRKHKRGGARTAAAPCRLARAGCPATSVQMLEDGDVLRFDGTEAKVVGRIQTGRVLVDGTRMGEVGDEVLRDRRHLAGDGLIVAVVAINGQTGALERAPEVIARGMATDPRLDDLLRDAPALLTSALGEAPRDERTDPGLVKERIRLEVQRMFRRRAGRRPMVLPVVMEM